MSNVFAYTGVTPEAGYVPFVSINERDGELTVTARQANHQPSSVTIPDSCVLELIESLSRYAAERGLAK